MTSNRSGSAVGPRHIPPKSLILSRGGFLQVTRKTSVVDDDKLYFTVPWKQMQRAIDSLQVFDSRGTTPRITFPSSSFSFADGLNMRAEDAWSDLVKEQQGAFVQIFMGDDSAEGHLIGLRQHGEREATKTSVLLLLDAKVSAYDIASVTSISFRESPAFAELEKYTTSKHFDLDTKDDYRITIVTTGSGPGEVSVSYSQMVSGVPFWISYLISPPDGTPAYGIHQNMLLKCFATIRNPLPCDIDKVEVTIQGKMYQDFPKTTMYTTGKENGGDGQDAGSSGTSSEQNEEQKGSDAASSSSELSDIDNLFETSSASVSQTSVDAYLSSYCAVLATTILSLKEGACARVALFEEHCEAGLVHFYDSSVEQCTLSLYIRNTSRRNLEPGVGYLSSPDIESRHIFSLIYLKSGQRAISTFKRYTGCRGVARSTCEMERVISCSKVKDKLLATVMFCRTTQYMLHNLEDHDMDILVFHNTAQSSRREVESKAFLYENLKPVGGGGQNGTTTAIRPRPSGYYTLADYYIQVASKERCRLVVTEHVKKDVEIPFMDNLSIKLIAILEKNEMIGSKVLEELLDILRIEREIEFLTKKRSSHRKRLNSLINHQREEAYKNDESPDQSASNLDEDRVDGVVSTYMRFVARSDIEMKTIQEVMDDIDYRLISLQHDLKAKKKALTERESLK